MLVRIKEIANTAQNSISPMVCSLVGLSPIIWQGWSFNKFLAYLFGRNQLETSYDISVTWTKPWNGHNSWRCRVSSREILNQFHTNPIRLMFPQKNGSDTNWLSFQVHLQLLRNRFTGTSSKRAKNTHGRQWIWSGNFLRYVQGWLQLSAV